MTKETIYDTPLFLRNWDDLLRTVPGVQISRYTQQSGDTSAGRTGDFNVNGVHSLQNNFILDGIDNNTFSENVQELSTESAHPSVDVISEFNVITNPYSAEYGRSAGRRCFGEHEQRHQQVSRHRVRVRPQPVLRCHRLLLQADALEEGRGQSESVRRQPRRPDRRRQAFFFFNYEGTRIKQGVSRISTVPLDNERIGDFSAAAAGSGRRCPVSHDQDPTHLQHPVQPEERRLPGLPQQPGSQRAESTPPSPS